MPELSWYSVSRINGTVGACGEEVDRGEGVVGVKELLDDNDEVGVTEVRVLELEDMIDDDSVGTLGVSLPDTGSRSLTAVLIERVIGEYLVDGTK